MKRISVLLYEISYEELEELPFGFPLLQYNTLTRSVRALSAQVDHCPTSARYVYLLYKEPPASFRGCK